MDVMLSGERDSWFFNVEVQEDSLVAIDEVSVTRLCGTHQ